MKTLEERFWEKVQKGSECWQWAASKNTGGYGKICISGKLVQAHRVAWELSRGNIPQGQCVLHRCDVRSCVNPEHLFLGTHEDNMKDRDKKNRQSRGLRHRELSGVRRTSDRPSQYRGVCWHKQANKWRASVYINQKLKHLGFYNDEKEAAAAYLKAVNKIEETKRI